MTIKKKTKSTKNEVFKNEKSNLSKKWLPEAIPKEAKSVDHKKADFFWKKVKKRLLKQ